MKMWSGRFREPLDPFFENWQRSFPFDQRLLEHELRASGAYARALQKTGVLTSAEVETIESGLKQIGELSGDPEFLNNKEAEDVHHFVEMQLTRQIGDVGLKLHSGRSRNEQIATDLRLYVREQIDSCHKLVLEFSAALLERAKKAGQNAMPSYTHLQRAEPVLVAHWLLAYFNMFLRDAERLADGRKRVNVCPLGSGAISGSTIALDRESLAHELGFDGPSANSMDATSDRDFAIELVQTLSLLAVHLSRWAEEFILFATQEYGFIQLPEAYSTGSSAMPQKQNPDALELIRAKSARLVGNSVTLLTTVKGLPLAYNKDLQDTQEPLFDAVETIVAILKLATGFMAAVQFDFAATNQAAKGRVMNAFSAATYLVNQGVPFRIAHEQVGKAVRLCLEKNCGLEDLALEELQQINPKFEADFYTAMSLDSVLGVHDVHGGTAPTRVKQAIIDAENLIAELRGELCAHA